MGAFAIVASATWLLRPVYREYRVRTLIAALSGDHVMHLRRHAASVKAAEALGRMKEPRAVEPLVKALREQSKAYAEQRSSGDTIEEVELRTWGPPAFSATALEALGTIGIAAVGPLVRACRDRVLSDDEATRAFARMDGTVRDTLLAQLGPSGTPIQTDTIYALGAMRERRAASRFLEELQRGDRWRRMAAARALGQIGDPAAVPALIAALAVPDQFVVEESVQSLAELKDGRAVKPLLHLCVSQRFDPARGASSVWRDYWDAVPEALIAAAHDHDPAIRREAVARMHHQSDARVLRAVVEATHDVDPSVQERAVGSLDSDRPEALPVFLWAIGSSEVRVRKAGALRLSGSRDPRAVAALKRALDERDTAVIAAAHRYFMEIQGAEPLLEMALDECGDVEMANAFLNSGSARLDAAARRWGARRGLRVGGHYVGDNKVHVR